MTSPLTLKLPLHTPRLILRDFVTTDFSAVLHYSSNAELARFMFYQPRDSEDTYAYLQAMLQTQAEIPRHTWELAVVRMADNKVVGACNLTLQNAREAELGFALAEEEWRKGYASELAVMLVHAGFAQLHLQRIFALAEIKNVASLRVLEKAGLKHEATVYGYKKIKGRSWDMHQLVISRHEWLRHNSAMKLNSQSD